MSTIPIQKRAQLSEMIQQSRRLLGLSADELARQASERTKDMANVMKQEGGIVTAEELSAWKNIAITRRHIQGLEGCPKHPASTLESRGRLFAVCLVLDLDRNQVNKLIGGI